MQFSLRAENMSLPEAGHERLRRRLGRLKKHLTPPFEIDVTISADRHHRTGSVYRCRVRAVTVTTKQAVYADRKDSSWENACDAAIEVVERKLRRAHDKLKRHQ